MVFSSVTAGICFRVSWHVGVWLQLSVSHEHWLMIRSGKIWVVVLALMYATWFGLSCAFIFPIFSLLPPSLFLRLHSLLLRFLHLNLLLRFYSSSSYLIPCFRHACDFASPISRSRSKTFAGIGLPLPLFLTTSHLHSLTPALPISSL